MACLRPYPNFNANDDAQVLRDAMKGMGTDEDAIINVLAYRTVVQRQAIEDAYKAQFGEDLKKKLKGELSGDFELAILWSFYDRGQLNAAALQRAMKGAGTDEDVLIDIICTASNSKIVAIKEAFQELTGGSLEDAIESECISDFKRVLIAIIQGCRQKGCDEGQARADAQELFEVGEDKIGTDERTFIRLMCNSSFKQIRLIDECYQELAGHDLITAIEKELSGYFEMALKRIVQYAKNRLATVSEMLYNTMKGAGTSEAVLIRIVLGYAEAGLGLIKGHFEQNYEQSLADMIAGDTSGACKKFLLAIVQ